MARVVNRLSARQVATIKTAGMHADGAGLYLYVERTSAKRWTFIFQWDGRRKEMGLGPLNTFSLAEAREAAAEARRMVTAGINPIEARKEKLRAAAAAAADRAVTFGEVAEEVLESLEGELSNMKHHAQWRTSLTVTAAALCKMPVADITTDDVIAVLKPVWKRTPESAARLRGRIERVFAAAKAKGLRSAENPARWKNHLDTLLPRRNPDVQRHHAALSYKKVSEFMAQLRAREAVSARALEFTILTAARTNETLGARWSEIDTLDGLWTIPAERMKARAQHTVPLPKAALRILEEVRPLLGQRNDGFVFPGQKRDRPLSQMSMLMLLRRMKLDQYTVHGFRSTFRDWAGDCTNFSREIVETSLAHTMEKAERAYRRTRAIEKRRQLMEAWSGFCNKVQPRAAPGDQDRKAA